MKYFTVLAILTLFAHIPEFVFMAAWLILPGIVLLFAPVVFGYSLAVFAAWYVVRHFVSRESAVATAVAVIIVFAAGIPLLDRLFIRAEAEQFLFGDKEASVPVGVPESVALFYLDEPSESSQSGNSDLCRELCLRLLYNHATKRVFVHAAVSDPSAQGYVAHYYYLEHRDRCPSPHTPKRDVFWPGDTTHLDWRRTVAEKAANEGECLLQGQGVLAAKMVLAEYDIPSDLDWPPAPNGGPRPTSVRRLELWKKVDGELKLIDRKTQVRAPAMCIPLGLFENHGMSSLGIAVCSTGIDIFDDKWGHDMIIQQYQRIFGAAVAMPKERNR